MDSATASAPSGPTPSRGRTIGRYVLYDEIACGGMASIHLARHVGPVGFTRTVAIKRPHPHLARQPAFVSMFVEEARLAARIRHPNVVPTIDVVVEEDELFLVMEYVTGDSLRGVIEALAERRRRMPLEVAVRIVADALYGLHAAHEARDDSGVLLGMVHRDVSPHNIMVGCDGIARLLDFGLAKVRSRAESTAEGQLKGKLAYMAPEQLLGLSLDRRTDVFASAIVLWEVLTGARLFAGANEGEVTRRVLEAPIAAPSERADSVPRALDAIVLRGLARDREARYPTAEEMARALETVVNPAPRADVASFVTEHVGDIVERRTARIAEIERESGPVDRAGADVGVAA